MTAKLDKVLTIPEVAAIAGWDAKRMRRHLIKVNAEVGGMLLRNTGSAKNGNRWTVTLAALQQVAPQWFTDPVTTQARIEALEAEVKQLRRMAVLTNETIARLVA